MTLMLVFAYYDAVCDFTYLNNGKWAKALWSDLKKIDQRLGASMGPHKGVVQGRILARVRVDYLQQSSIRTLPITK